MTRSLAVALGAGAPGWVDTRPPGASCVHGAIIPVDGGHLAD